MINRRHLLTIKKSKRLHEGSKVQSIICKECGKYTTLIEDIVDHLFGSTNFGLYTECCGTGEYLTEEELKNMDGYEREELEKGWEL